ncbi:MAG: fibronectin type III domain-containing protein, partial [Armatimonadetes bacterium]|nr:fibronectin type III domain-containing protein [Armatimonadota bacterium]
MMARFLSLVLVLCVLLAGLGAYADVVAPISVDPPTLDLGAQSSNAIVTIKWAQPGPWRLEKDQPWISISPNPMGPDSLRLQVFVNRAGLPPGNHAGKVMVFIGNLPPVVIPVKMAVMDQSGTPGTPPTPPGTMPPPPGRLEISPATVSFPKDDTSLPAMLTNRGSAPLQWRIAQKPGWLTVSPTSGMIPPGASAQVMITFPSWVAGVREGQVLFETAQGQPPIPLVVQIPPAPAQLSIQDVQVTDVTENGATIRWTTSLPAGHQVEYGPSPSFGQYSPPIPSPATSHAVQLSGLTPGGKYYYRVRSTAGSVSAMEPHGGADEAHSFVTRSVAITPPPVLTLDREQMEFGPQQTEQLLVIRNTGGSDLNWQTLPSPQATAEPPSGKLGPGASVQVRIQVNRKGMQPGEHSSLLALTSNGGNKQIALRIHGPSSAKVEVQPAELSFGEAADRLELVLSNKGEASTIVRLASPDLPVQFQPSPEVVLEGSATARVTVILNRTGKPAGAYRGAVSLQWQGGATQVQAQYAVKGEPAGSPPLLVVDRERVTFGPNESEQRLQLKNGGGQDLIWRIERHVFCWAPSGEIQVQAEPLSGTLKPGESGIITLRVPNIPARLPAEGLESVATPPGIAPPPPGRLIIGSNGGVKTIEVTLQLPLPEIPRLEVSPKGLNFGDAIPSASLLIRNSGKGALKWRIEGNPRWLAMSQMFGQGDATVILTPDRKQFKGEAKFSLTVTSNGGTSTIEGMCFSPIKPAVLALRPETPLAFPLGANEQTIGIQNTGEERLNWNAILPQGVTVTPQSGALGPGESGQVKIAVNREALPSGSPVLIRFAGNGGSKDLALQIQMQPPTAGSLKLGQDQVVFTKDDSSANVRLTNEGSARVDWRIDSVPPLGIQLSTRGGSLEPRQSAELTIRFPSYVDVQPREGVVLIQTGIPGQSPLALKVQIPEPPYQVKIENLRATVISPTEATIEWNTTRPAGKYVQYGTTPALGQHSVPTAGKETTHQVRITGLKPGAKYYFQAHSGSESVNAVYPPAPNEQYTFTTTGGIVRPPMLVVDRDSLVFTRERLQHKFTVRNDGGRDLEWRIQAPGDSLQFDHPGGTLKPGGSELVSVSLAQIYHTAGPSEEEAFVAKAPKNLIIESNGGTKTIALSFIVIPIPPKREPMLKVSPGQIDFGEALPSAPLTISNAVPNTTLDWKIEGAPEWLRISLPSGQNNAVIHLTPDRKLIQGEGRFRLTVTSNGGTAIVEGICRVAIKPAVLSLKPDSSLAFPAGTNDQVISVMNTGQADLNWTAAPQQGVAITPQTGTVKAGESVTARISVNREALPKGTPVTVRFGGNGGNKDLALQVQFQPLPTAMLEITSPALGSLVDRNIRVTGKATGVSEVEVFVTTNQPYLQGKAQVRPDGTWEGNAVVGAADDYGVTAKIYAIAGTVRSQD